jgi:hypothetical protein
MNAAPFTGFFVLGQFGPFRRVLLAAILAFGIPANRGPALVPERGFQKSEVLRTVLDGIQDGTEQIDEIGLYLLLREMGQRDWGSATGEFEEVSWSTLIGEPEAYRGKWVRVACRFVEAERGQLDNPQLWPKPVFTVMGIDEKNGEPVSMVATVGPGFDRNDPVWLEGLFFKIRADAPRNAMGENINGKLLIPVLVGREVRARNAFGGSDSARGREVMGWSIGVVGVLLAVWLMARSRSNRSGRSQPRRWGGEGEVYGEDAFEPIDLERLENNRFREDSENR